MACAYSQQPQAVNELTVCIATRTYVHPLNAVSLLCICAHAGGIPQESVSGSENSVVFGQYCNSDDHETLRKFVVDLTKQILLSTLNVMQKALSEPVQARKASVGKFWNKSWKSLKNMTSSGTSLPPM